MARLARFGLPLHDAARQGDIGKVTLLVASGSIDVNLRGPAGWAALLCAVEGGHEDVMRFLLNNGPDASTTTAEGLTVLHICAKLGNLAATKLLVKAGSDLDAVTSTTSPTPLLMAAGDGHSEVMTVLIEAGASIDFRTHEADTPLYTSWCSSWASRRAVDQAAGSLRSGLRPRRGM